MRFAGSGNISVLIHIHRVINQQIPDQPFTENPLSLVARPCHRFQCGSGGNVDDINRYASTIEGVSFGLKSGLSASNLISGNASRKINDETDVHNSSIWAFQ